MKKTIALLLAMVLGLSLCACGSGTNDTPNTPKTAETTAPRENMMTTEEMLANAIKLDVVTFLKECSSNIAKVSSEYEGEICAIEGYISEIEKDHIVLQYKYLYVNVFLPVEQIIELQREQYIEVVGTLANLNYDAYSGAFADLSSACVSKDMFIRTGEYNAYHSTDGTHPQGVCLKCVDDSGNVYYIALELSDEQKSTLENGMEITVEGKLFSNYWDTMPHSADLKMIEFVIK